MQRLVIHGKGCALGLGSFALVPLAEARQRALANRRVARLGGDPRPAARRAPGIPTFDEAVATVLAIHETEAVEARARHDARQDGADGESDDGANLGP